MSRVYDNHIAKNLLLFIFIRNKELKLDASKLLYSSKLLLLPIKISHDLKLDMSLLVSLHR